MGKTAILSVRILGDATGATQAMGDTETKAGGLAGKIKGLGPVALGLGAAVVAGVVVAGKGLFDLGARFDDVKDTIRIGTGATGEALEGMKDVAMNVAQTIPTSFEAAATAVADVNTRLGLSGDTLDTVASQYLEAGRILGEEVDIASSSAALNAFKVNGDDVSTSLDSMFQVSQATGISMNDLSGILETNAAALQGLGFGFEESAALAGTLDKAGIDASATLGSMKKGLVTLAKSGEEPASAFKRVTGEIGGFIDTGDKAAALDLASKVFGTKGAVQFVAAVESGVLGTEDLMGAMGATQDTILGVGQETMDAAEKWEILKNKGLAALEPLAAAVFDGVGNAIGYLTTLFDSVDWSTFTTAAQGVGDTLAGIGPVIQSVGAWINDTLIPPLLGVVAVVQENWPTIQALVVEIFDAIIAKIEPLIPTITTIFTTIGQIIGLAMQVIGEVISIGVQLIVGIWKLAGQPLINIISTIWTSIIGVIKPAIDLIKSIIQTGLAILRGDWSGAWDGIKGIVSNAWALIKGIVTGGFDIIKSIFSGAVDVLKNLAALAWERTAGAFTDGINKVTGFVRGIPGKITSALGNMGNLLTGAGRAVIDGFVGGLKRAWQKGKDFIGGIGSWIAANKGPISKDKVLLKPAGAAIMGGFIGSLKAAMPELERWVGDATRTVMGLEADPTIDLNTTTARMAGAGAGATVINIHGALDAAAVARQVRDLLTTDARRTGRVVLNGRPL